MHFKLIENTINPFDNFIKLNIRSSFTYTIFGHIAMSVSNTLLKNSIDLSIILACTQMNIIGQLPQFTKVRKSIAKFKTREGDLISSTAKGHHLYLFVALENAMRYEVLEYYGTLKRANFGLSTVSSSSLSFPDFRYLFWFKNFSTHELKNAFGFDFSANFITVNSNVNHKESLPILLFSSLSNLALNCWDDNFEK